MEAFSHSVGALKSGNVTHYPRDKFVKRRTLVCESHWGGGVVCWWRTEKNLAGYMLKVMKARFAKQILVTMLVCDVCKKGRSIKK